jgi:hypothetical protein
MAGDLKQFRKEARKFTLEIADMVNKTPYWLLYNDHITPKAKYSR